MSFWNNICLGWEIFSRHTRLVIGDGTGVWFWHDQWCGDTNLKDDFLVLFSIAREKEPQGVGPSDGGLVLKVCSLQGPKFNTSWVQTIAWGHTPW